MLFVTMKLRACKILWNTDDSNIYECEPLSYIEPIFAEKCDTQIFNEYEYRN